MPRDKSKARKTNSNPFCKKRKSRKKPKVKLSDENKKLLAATDKGSYFNQDKQWPELLSENINKANPNLTCSTSRSRKKLETGKESLLKRKADELETSESDFESECSVSDTDSEVEGITDYESPPTGNFIISVACLQEMLENATVCKVCHNPLTLLEKKGSRQGLAAMWLYSCTNSACESHQTRVPTPTSERTGPTYNINVASVVAFRAIGKGRAAAEKCLAILNVPSPVYTWDKHTKLLGEKVEVLKEICMKDAALEVKQFMRDCGKIPECTDQELGQKLVDIGTSFDCSWSSRGWSARDGVVAAISEDTGKVVDVVFMTGSCPSCKTMEDKRAQGDISKLEFLDWYIKHEPNCEKNHDGSAQVKRNSNLSE